MSKSKGDAHFVYQQDNGLLIARANHFSKPVRITELNSVAIHETSGNPFLGIKRDSGAKKGFTETHFVVSNKEFAHFFHRPESASKSKNADYIPNAVKVWLDDEHADFYYQILDWETGEIVPIEEPSQNLMLISGMKTRELRSLQGQMVSSELYPVKLECSVVLMLGFIKKLMAASMLKPPVMLLEVYQDSALLVVVSNEGKPLLRKLESGESSMYEQVKNELGLKDLQSAQKLMYSSTIDLSDIGQQVIRPLYREIGSVVGLFEVETGMSVSQLLMTNIMPSQRWISDLLANDLGMQIPGFDLSELCGMLDIQIEETVEWNMKDHRILPLLASMGVL